MTAEVIEGEVREVDEPRALTVVRQQPGQAIVAEAADPSGMVQVATRLATVLKDIVDRQHLYADIRGKRYPTVEAWMTIARLDNVVAREPRPPIRHDDGSYEAFAELVRLSDGMVIGGASALCGTPDDVAGRQDWSKQSEPSRRSMAQTRATSRAFRQQYAWIMALAGYQPTPAEEMPRDDPEHEQARASQRDENRSHAADGGLIGTAEVGKSDANFELQQTPTGTALAFRLVQGRKGFKVIARDALAVAIAGIRADVEGQTVTCWGQLVDVDFTPKDSTRKVTYQVLTLDRMTGPTFSLPAPVEAESVPMFSEAEDAAIDDALAALEAGA